jgi:chemotaxis signal transduction protein
VTFWLADTEYAFDVSDVVEMVPVPSVTPVPGVVERVAGVTNWRGRTIPVLDLRTLLKVEDRAPDVKKRLLVLSRPGPWGALIERPGRIVPASASEPVDSSRPETDRDAVARPRLVRTEEGLVQVLDAAQLIGNGPDRVRGESRR